jgi:hypothetical protein
MGIGKMTENEPRAKNMLVTFLKRLSYKNLKTVKTLKIQQGSAKIWRFKVRKKSIFSNKMADFSDF